MEMAPKGLYKISIPSKPIKIVHTISLQNDSPQPHFLFALSPSFTKNLLYKIWFWEGKKNKGIL